MILKKRITVVIPTKNEEGSIAHVINNLPMDIIHEVIVVDANSKDRTKEIAKSLGAKVLVQTELGYGNGVSLGLSQSSGEFVTFVDADGSYDTQDLYRMIDLIDKDNDIIFCSRYAKGAVSYDDTFIRYVGNKVFTYLLNKLYGVKITDALFLYVLAKTEKIKKINMKSRYFDWCIEFPIRIHQAGLKYNEIPSTEKLRFAGVSKVNAFTDGLNILLTLIKIKFSG